MRIPTDRIDAEALTRDRTVIDPHAMEELQGSIRANGLRMPIEVYETETGYALLSGYRRLAAVRALHEATGLADFAGIEAIIRPAVSRAAALAAMVEENEQRAALSAWERGRIALSAVEEGTFATLDEAIPALYPQARRQKRARIRAVAEVVEALEDTLTDPEALTENQLLRLSSALRNGWRDLIVTAIEQKDARDPRSQWEAMRPTLDEHDGIVRENRDPNPARPRRLSRPRAGIVIRRERMPTGWCLYVTGRGVQERLVRDVLEQVEFLLGPPG